MRLLKSIQASAVAAIAILLSVPALGQGTTMRLILKGYDPVGYFTEGKPVQGKAQYAYDWDDGRYYFANARNRDTFAADPDRYAPRFAGHCAGSVTRGVKNEGDPTAWIIVDGKLYVFGRPMDAEYLAKYPEKIPQANKEWQKIKARAS